MTDHSSKPRDRTSAIGALALATALAVAAAWFTVPATAQDRPAAAQPAPPSVPYPAGYRHWTHVKSMVIQEGHPLYQDFGGIHHLYANAPALRVLEAGKPQPFPDGAVIVFDLLAAASQPGALTEGDRKFIGVMHKDRRAYAATGGWGFAAFAGSSRDPVAVDPAKCFACHQGASKTDYVFADWRR